ncbi:MAG: hypothetical protein ACM3SQ_00815 [Betaproteobacteria bacterium]
MIAAATTDASLMAPYQAEWRTLRAHRHNVLLEGPVAATSTVLRLLQPHMRGPTLWHRHGPLSLPSGEAGALILADVAALDADDQTRLLEWLVGTGAHTQIVSMTERPLFALVMLGLFDAALYYRLNVVLLYVGSGHPPGLHDDDAEPAHGCVDSPTSVATR